MSRNYYESKTADASLVIFGLGLFIGSILGAWFAMVALRDSSMAAGYEAGLAASEQLLARQEQSSMEPW